MNIYDIIVDYQLGNLTEEDITQLYIDDVILDNELECINTKLNIIQENIFTRSGRNLSTAIKNSFTHINQLGNKAMYHLNKKIGYRNGMDYRMHKQIDNAITKSTRLRDTALKNAADLEKSNSRNAQIKAQILRKVADVHHDFIQNAHANYSNKETGNIYHHHVVNKVGVDL